MKHISAVLLASFVPAIGAYGDGLSSRVTDYGASCDGTLNPRPAPCSATTDDTCGINAALAAVCAASSGGGEVIIPVGTCVINPGAGAFQLCSNLTFRGTGPKSVLQVRSGSGAYQTFFAGRSGEPVLSNVVIKDFRIDQNPVGNPNPPAPDQLFVINLSVNISGASGITVSGMTFDPISGTQAIHLENNGDLKATITNNYFNFNKAGSSAYSNTAVYLEGSQQVVTGNAFLASPDGLTQNAGTAVETHGGRSAISNNTANYYATAVKVMPSSAVVQTPLSPNDVVVASNSVTCAQNGISIVGRTAQTIQSVSINGNVVHVCNNARLVQQPSLTTIFTGIAYDGSTPGDVDGLVISNNVIAMENQSAPYTSVSSNGGILLNTIGNLSNVVVSGNSVTNSPVSGIRVGSSSNVARRVRITDNTIVDAGNNSQITGPTDIIYRHAIGLTGLAADIDIQRNMILDTNVSGTANGIYSLYLQPSLTSVNVRTSQNTLRLNGQGSLLSPQSAVGQIDTSSAGDIKYSTVQLGTGGTQGLLSVDFMSFGRYVTTINGSSANAPVTLRVDKPRFDDPPASLYFTHGQVVTFRFLCSNQGGCSVIFDNTYAVEAGWDTVVVPIPNGMGRAISFQAEVPPPSSPIPAHYFFQLYRSDNVPNG